MSNYSLVKLKDLIINITDNRGKTPPLVESGIELIETPSLRGDNKYVDFSKINKYVSQETYETWFRSGHPKNGDILITLVGTIGKVCIFKDNRGCIAQNIVALEFNEYCNSEFMYYYLSSPIMQNQISFLNRQSAQPNLKVPDFINLAVSLPPLKEQQKIAEILSSVDAAIEKTEQVIAKTEEVKKGLMQQLLTKGIGHTEFKQTELGEIPVEWEVVKFNDICKNITDKFDPKIEEVKTYIALEHIEQTTGKLLGTDISTSSTSLKTQFKKDDVLFGKLRPYLRKYVYADFEGVCATEILVLRSKDICYSKYLFLLVQEENFLEFIASRTFGTKMPRTSWNEIKEYSIPLPQLQEQYEVVKIVGHLSKKLESETIKLDKLKDIKSGLMQQLLTGQVRVKID